MDVLIKNFDWMGFNIFLAMLGLLFGWLFFYAKNKLFAFCFFILWVMFVPNTIYLITDLQHIYNQWHKVSFFIKPLLVSQYFIVASLGILTFITSMFPINKVFNQLRISHNPILKGMLIILFNIAIAFALILGKYERTHSWYLFTDLNRVLSDITSVISNPIMLSLVLLFSIVINLVYFAFRKIVPIPINPEDPPKRRHHK